MQPTIQTPFCVRMKNFKLLKTLLTERENERKKHKAILHSPKRFKKLWWTKKITPTCDRFFSPKKFWWLHNLSEKVIWTVVSFWNFPFISFDSLVIQTVKNLWPLLVLRKLLHLRSKTEILPVSLTFFLSQVSRC